MQVGDLPVITIGVARRREGVAQLPDGAVLVRRGASDVPLLGEALVSLISRRAFTPFETTAVDATLESADPELLDRLRDAWGGRAARSSNGCGSRDSFRRRRPMTA